MTKTEKNEALDNLTYVRNDLHEIARVTGSLNVLVETVKEIVDDSEVHAYLTLIGAVCDKLEGLADRDYILSKLFQFLKELDSPE